MSKRGQVVDDVLAAFMNHAGSFRARFERQNEHCEVAQYVETEGGFYAVLRVDREKCEPLGGPGRQVMSGVWGRSTELVHGADFMLFMKDGYLSLLECARIGPPWGPVPKDTVFQLTCDVDLATALEQNPDGATGE